MKKIIFLIVFFFSSIICSGAEIQQADNSSAENIIYKQLDELNLTELEDMMELVNESGAEAMPDLSFKQMIGSLLKGEKIFDYRDIINKVIKIFFSEIFTNSRFLIEVIIIAIIIALLKNLSSSFGETTVSNMASIVCSCVVISLCLGSLRYTYGVCSETIETMISFMQAILPVLITLLISIGNLATGALFNPVILAAINIFSAACHKFILPAVFLSCTFFLINSITEHSYIKKLASFMRQCAVFIMGLMATLFSGLTAVQGIVSSSADGVLVKTAKFSIDNFVPIVGGFMADSVDLVLSCTALLKNSVGAIGVITLIFLMLIPMIKLLAVAVMYKIASIILEPIGSGNISDCLNEMGNTVIVLLIIMVLASIMFLIFLTILINTGSSAVTAR